MAGNQTIIQVATRRLYLGSYTSDRKNKGTLFFEILKVGKSKLPLFFGIRCFISVLLSVYLLNLALLYNGSIPSGKMAKSPITAVSLIICVVLKLRAYF